MNNLDFCIFTDTHYSKVSEIGTRRPSKSLDKFKIMLENLHNKDVSNIICLGDIINAVSNKAQNIENYVTFINCLTQYDMKMFLVLGNHDMEALTNNEFKKLSPNINIAPFTYESDNRLLIFLDANYDIFGNAYKDENDWIQSYVPQFQLDMLYDTLSRADKEAVIFIHQNLDNRPNDPHIVKNAPQVREILERSGKVKQVYQGHYHHGMYNLQNGIEYITLKAMCELDDLPYVIVDL